MGKLYHYCANNQKIGDPEWELMPSTLESMLATIEHDRASELLHSKLPQSSLQCTGIIPSVSQFLANIHASSQFVIRISLYFKSIRTSKYTLFEIKILRNSDFASVQNFLFRK